MFNLGAVNSQIELFFDRTLVEPEGIDNVSVIAVAGGSATMDVSVECAGRRVADVGWWRGWESRRV